MTETEEREDLGEKIRQIYIDAVRYRKLKHHLSPDLCDYIQAAVQDELQFDSLIDDLGDPPE